MKTNNVLKVISMSVCINGKEYVFESISRRSRQFFGYLDIKFKKLHKNENIVIILDGLDFLDSH